MVGKELFFCTDSRILRHEAFQRMLQLDRYHDVCSDDKPRYDTVPGDPLLHDLLAGILYDESKLSKVSYLVTGPFLSTRSWLDSIYSNMRYNI